jgi:hypothetical protein
MYSCVIKINNEDYIPVRAIPYCTASQFTPADVICLLTDPESHADSEFNNNVVPFLYSEVGDLEYQAPNLLLKYKSNLNTSLSRNECFLDQVRALPAKMLVKLAEMRRFNDFLINDSTNNNMPVSNRCQHYNFTWLDDPDMTFEEKSAVCEGFENLYQTQAVGSRLNSTTQKLETIKQAVDKIEVICNNCNVRFSKNHVPGQKAQLLDCIKLIEPSIKIALSTFDGPNYIGKLNLKWLQGERKESGEAMVAAIRIAMGVN